MSEELVAGLLGGTLGGVLGAAGSWLAAYVAPRKLEEERERRAEERIWGPRKELIREMLQNAADGQGRSFKTLKRVTGTPDDDLRRLLVELGARGFTRNAEDGQEGEEAWIFREQRPLKPLKPQNPRHRPHPPKLGS